MTHPLAMPASPGYESSTVPLCVDLDGTVIKTDLVWESLVRLLRRNPLWLLIVPLWLLRGRAWLKQQLAARIKVDVSTLPYIEPLLDFLRGEQRSHRPILLVTAADLRMAAPVAAHLGLFTEVMASEGKINLRGKNKGARLVERFGLRGFDYAGNSSVDLPVWERSRCAIVVNAPARLAARAQRLAPVSHVFAPTKFSACAWLQALRPGRWVKNLILFIPLLISGQITESERSLKALLGFVAFGLCASGIYLLNDLADLDLDRHDPVRRMRPFAAGNLPLPAGLVIFPLLLAAGAGLACQMSQGFLAALGLYVVLAASYSWHLKQVPMLKVLCLSGLLTIRLWAGYAAIGTPCSFWLLALFFIILIAVKKILIG